MGAKSAADAPDLKGEPARNPRTPPWREPWTSLPGVGRWADLPGQERFWRIAYVVSQVAVRGLLALVLLTVAANTGVLSSDGSVAKRGTALATHCESTGPVSRAGLGWYWACDAQITWSDGTETRKKFLNSELTPENETRPEPVVYRKVRNSADQIAVDKPMPFVGLGYALFIALVFATFYGVRIPGLPPMPAERRAERRRRVRLQWWQPLALPIGWGLVVAGGLGTASAATGRSVLVIVFGFVALIAGWFVSQGRRKYGVLEPKVLPPDQTRRFGKVGRLLVIFGCAAAVLSAVTAFPEWLNVISAVAVPLAVVAVGWRLSLVANRRSGGTDLAETASNRTS
ncbi:DUF6346 domain-containing protein [Saccharopolyspora sp. WRP15-2]|uniref:DUF6346 domain-containing protein n=1 Tax=Saccharopolyspora oryzae TaxID=2997343 RepID=A0ABT4V650_9PSEU|nr:DUF6346 domain-containing protein [Saccharopolyspora oryzae]MDA3629445.1 DUF6346 domain-containing protein [Saccharopolyspora oryzae]